MSSKFILRIISAIFIFGLFLLQHSSVSAQSVNNFTISHYEIDYYLSKDAENRSTLKTEETIKALFPQTDQNHGIERAVPNVYDGHPTDLTINSVTDESGNKLPYSMYNSNNNTVLRIGDADRYVHGPQTYKVTYTQRDVTRFFKDTNADEFYWDTNGTEWAVPINVLNVRLYIDSKISGALAGQHQCYFGKVGSTTQCRAIFRDNIFATTAIHLQPGENVTFAVGFKPNTFKGYEQPFFMKLLDFWMISLAVTFNIAVGLVIWFSVYYYRRSNRAHELGTVVPEYLPPKDTSVSIAGRIFHKHGNIFSAQLIDLAVRHYIKIYQTREKSLFKSANYELEIVKSVDGLKAEEREVLKDIFDEVKVDARIDMASLKSNRAKRLKLSDNQQKLDKSIAGKYGLRAKDKKQSSWFRKAALFTFVVAILTLSPWLLAASIVSLVMSFTSKPLTDKGLALTRYLKGLEMYIKVAETERLKMLQSPDGAEKVGMAIDPKDTRQLVKLYERVLPYAILFGQETQWNKRLGAYYESLNESPTWYTGHNAVFNAAVFSAAIHGFDQVASYSDPTSSSSGGSSGGGSSGGGGGGGGGGGW